MQTIDFVLRGEYITLDALLKAPRNQNLGGAAKVLIAGGEVRVNGEVDTRRGRKCRAGDEVVVGAIRVRVGGAEAAA